uniref:Uncharacterized protein n=1 Tax=Cacopsylla melanoneura TaxID=428564 RepID=A0A8D9F497_9HEMI
MKGIFFLNQEHENGGSNFVRKPKKMVFGGFFENGWSDFKNLSPSRSNSSIRFFLTIMKIWPKKPVFEFFQKEKSKNRFFEDFSRAVGQISKIFSSAEPDYHYAFFCSRV